MIRQLANTMARGASLIVTDRRWGVTLSATALGFGLFVGVAIGPGAAGTLATGPQQLIALSDPAGSGGEAEAETGDSPGSRAGSGPPPATGGESSSLESLPPSAPLATESSEPLAPAEEDPVPESKPPPAGEGEEVEPEATALAGTVVHLNPAAGSYTLAIEGGELVPVHAAKLPRTGTKLSLEGLRLANGTFAEEGDPKQKGQRAQSARFRGVVSFVDADPLSPGYTLSGRGASLFVEAPPDPAGAMPPLPTVGAYATAEVAIESDSSLVQRKLELEPGEPTTYLDLSGIYSGLDPETGLLLLSADDTRASEQDLRLAVPTEIDTAKLEPGDSYMVTATLEPDGSLELAGLASDEHRKGADDPKTAQGDLKTWTPKE